jgi:predicted PurR-regulated permease PerM
VPAAGLWAVLVVVVAIIQLPPILILAPVIVYVFTTDMGTVWQVVFAIYVLVVSGADGWLKPLFLGRGLKIPMLVILIGAIGGMLGAGVVGLFIGPVIFAIGYQIFQLWIKDVKEKETGDA